MFILIPAFMYGQETESKPKHQEEHYHISTFAGYSTDNHGKTGYKLGLEYEYRVSDKFGLGGTFDFTGKDFEIFSFSIGSTFYPFRFPLIPVAAVGFKNSKGDWKPFLRGILVYDFHAGNFSLGPMLMWDIYNEEKNILSYGLTIGYSLH